MGKVKIRVRRSVMGRGESERRRIEGLGLGKLNCRVEDEDRGRIRGMIDKVEDVIRVEKMGE